MTPTASRLKARLDERRMWFINEWLFKWHFIGKDGPVTIDSFDGRGIHYGGIKFDGTARLVYWDTIVRGVRKEITEQFAWVDQEVRNYNRETSLKAIDECAGLLAAFVRSIRREAVAKDCILRGDGINFPPENDAGRWEGTSDKEIASFGEALKAALPHQSDPLPTNPSVAATTVRQRASVYWHDNQWWLGPLGLAIGLAGLLPFVL
jgi:hypothetical protein